MQTQPRTPRDVPRPAPCADTRRSGWLAAAALVLALAGCQPGSPPAASTGGGLSPQAHQALRQAHDWSDPPAFADAERGRIAVPQGQVKGSDGSVAWDFDAFGFVQGDAPPTVHPGLWRQAQLNNRAGLFRVTEGIWQLRGFDLANMTLIQGRSGWIVVDPLTSQETAAHALAFARQHLGPQPVSAIVYTHSHVDHFGGVLGVVSAADAAARKLPVVAPVGFMDEATSENILAGNAMGRRSIYQFGRDLPRNAAGLVDGGLGKTTSYGHIGILPPTLSIDQPRQEQLIDGVRFVFYNVPGSEAPAEFTFALPDHKAYCGAELLTHTLHNVMTPRGAKVRDALRWARYMHESLQQVQGAEVFFASHHWPVFGAARIHDFITAQRDVMKYLHDQTVRLFNAGLNAEEIAEQLTVPPELDKFLHTHGYYGSWRHNVRAVVQFYLSSFDGNPANLDTLPRTELGRRLVDLAGGPDKALAAARAAFDRGDLRWAAQLLDALLRAAPERDAARELLARTYRQLGYASEASTWRNFYLTGAHELEAGPPAKGVSRELLLDMLAHTATERFLEAMAASVNGPKAAGLHLVIGLVFSDSGEIYRLEIHRSVMHHARVDKPPTDASATLTLTKPFFLRMVTGGAGAKDLLLSPQTRIDGSTLDLGRFFALLDKAPDNFAIVPGRP